jgi:hypothetical protein
MLIRDERELVLDDLVEHCRKVASHYREYAGLIEEPALGELFSETGRKHLELAVRLEEHLRDLGWLPPAPDPDAELVEELITRVKVAWSADKRHELLAEMLQAEDRLAAMIASALRQEISAELRSILKEMEEAADDTLKRLSSAGA